MPKNSLKAALVVAAFAFLPAFAEAKSYMIPENKPAAVVTIPDDWSVEMTRHGIEIQSEDDELYLAIEVTSERNIERDLEATFKWLASKGVTLNHESKKEVPYSINGMSGGMIYWDGKDKDGPTQISITILEIDASKGLMITGWGSEEGQKANLKELTAIVESLKAVR